MSGSNKGPAKVGNGSSSAKSETPKTEAPKSETPETDAPVDGEKKIKKASKKVVHPLVGTPDNFPFKEVPADYDFAIHKPLNKKAFSDPTGFMEYKARQLEFVASKFTKKAASIRNQITVTQSFGTAEQRKKANRFLQLKEAYAAIQASLAADGITEEQLASLEKAK